MGIQGDLFELCVDFIKEHKLDDLRKDNGGIREFESQEFFETVDEEDIIDFFNKLCEIFE